MDGEELNEGRINFMTYDIITYTENDKTPSHEVKEVLGKYRRTLNRDDDFKKALKDVESITTRKILLSSLTQNGREESQLK